MQSTKIITQTNKELLKKGKPLSLREKLFCDFYLSDEYFGNGERALRAFYEAQGKKIPSKRGLRTMASRMLTKDNVIYYINKKIERLKINNKIVDSQLAFLIFQMEDKKVKLGALHEYNTLHGRIIKRIDATTKGKSFNTDPEVAKKLNKILDENIES